MLREIKEFSAHMFWADGIIWQAIKKLEEKNIPIRLKEILYHIHSVQNAYLDIWLKKTVEMKDFKKFNNLAEISKWGFNFHTDFQLFLDRQHEISLNEPIIIPWTDSLEENLGKPVGTSTLSQQIFQVIMHSTYHRGQANKIIREAGGEPPLTDYIFWIWVGKPESMWEITS